jgi:hypothetical protein
LLSRLSNINVILLYEKGKNGIKLVYNCDFFARLLFSFHLSLFYQIDFCKFGENLRKVHN